MLALMYQGSQHGIWIPEKLQAGFQQWCEAMQRPELGVIIGTLKYVTQLPYPELSRLGKLWVLECPDTPKIYAIKKDQARIYCCLRGQDIVIVDWDQKKQQKADRRVLKRAQTRAGRVIDAEK